MAGPGSLRGPSFVLVTTSVWSSSCLGGNNADMGECPDMIACLEATGTSSSDVDEQYGEGGRCWEGDEEDQQLCRDSCSAALDGAVELYPDEPACGGEAAPPLPDCAADLEGTGYDPGDVAFDFEGTDQHGDPVSLYAECDREVLLMMGALWSAQTLAEASRLSEWHDAYVDRGLTILFAIAEDGDRNTPSEADLAAFAEEYDVEYTLLADEGWELHSRYDENGSFPTWVLFAPGAQIVKGDADGPIDESDIEANLP